MTDALSAAAVRSLSSDEPTWLAERRRHAWSVYERTALPTTHEEQWRYTDLTTKLSLGSLTLGAGPHLPDDPAAWPATLRAKSAQGPEGSARLVLVDGVVVQSSVPDDLTRQGVQLMSISEAVGRHGELLRKKLATDAVPPEDGKFAALNAALWTDGVFLLVPRGVHLEQPVRVTHWFGEPGAAYFGRTLIVAEPESQVSYVDELLSEDFTQQTLASNVVEVFAADGAQVQYATIQRLGRGAFYQSQQRTLANRNANVDTLNVTLGASTSRVDLNARLLGPGASSDMLGVAFGDGEQHFDHNTSQDHLAPDARSDLLFKGALAGRSRSVFRGIIRVHEGAQRTDAFQTNRNLLLSPHARADSLPNLEIAADDVRCSHAATVGELEDEALFYLMTRGLTREQAQRLAITGFLGEVLDRLALGGISDEIRSAIVQKLDG